MTEKNPNHCLNQNQECCGLENWKVQVLVALDLTSPRASYNVNGA